MTKDQQIKALTKTLSINYNMPEEFVRDVTASCHVSDVEVWYNEGTNTVILK